MDTKIMETLEMLEDRIESIKWLLAARFRGRKTTESEMSRALKRSFGILGKKFPNGITFENKIRKEWEVSFARRRG